MKCACDVCETEVTEEATKGRCAFCSNKCFGKSTVAGRETGNSHVTAVT